MSLDQLLALTTLAFVGSFTPGPNNTIATVTGANHGFRAVLPHMFGVPFGFSTMLIAGAAGIAALLIANPLIAALIRWAGIAYLLFIAWQLVWPDRSGGAAERTVMKPLSFWQSAAFQYANPKAWMLTAATTGTFMASGATITGVVVVVSVFAIAALGSLTLWGWMGAVLRNWLAVGSRMRIFNVIMGVLLAGTALWLALMG